MGEADGQPLFRHEASDCVDGVRFVATANDQVEIVGPRFSGAQELEPREPIQRGRHEMQRRDRHDRVAPVHDNQAQVLGDAELRPPRVQPFPGEERVVAAARSQQIIPPVAERQELRGVVNETNGHPVHYAALQRPRPLTCRAM